MTTVTDQLADMMFDLRTIEFRPSAPVRWTSGHLMPVYNDNRRLLAHPQARSMVVRGFEELIDSWDFKPDAVVGIATGGIAPATSLADRLGLRLYFVRSAPKGHGLARTLEGADDSGASGSAAPGGAASETVVLVEDLVSTGGSSAEAANAVHNAGLRINHGVAVFSYGFAAAPERFAALGFPFVMEPLVTIEDLLRRARERGRMEARDIDFVTEWLADPYAWGASREDGE